MLLWSILSFLPVVALSLQVHSCITYESYLVPGMSHDSRILTKISFRSRRLLGCCDSGYTYKGAPSFSCQPICDGGCQINSHCSEPNVCTCDSGYLKSADGKACLSNETLTSDRLTATATSAKVPCHGSCPINEVCSPSDGICVCQDGYQRLNETLVCVPKCDNDCQNADCTFPNLCTCWTNYERTNATFCHFKCTELSCVFGECSANGTCLCAEGFVNNGTNCLWAGNDIFSEPDDCECWSKFIWQKNMTENHCMYSCDDSDSPDCIRFNECEFYEGITICRNQMFKCIEKPTTQSPTSVIPVISDKVPEAGSLSTKLGILICGFLMFVLVVGLGLWIWKIRRNWFDGIWNYNIMEPESTLQEARV